MTRKFSPDVIKSVRAKKEAQVHFLLDFKLMSFLFLAFRRAILSCACCFALAAVAAGLPDFDALRARLQAGEHQAVLDELRSLEFDFAGEPEFDYLFGVSAIRAGEVNVGAFALERVLAVSPSHIGARFELAMSYVLLGNFEVGIKELEKLLARENLPESQRQIVLAFAARSGRLRPGSLR